MNELQQIQGTSGAIIVIHPTHVSKFAPRGSISAIGQRIEAQARYMSVLGETVCPKVFTTFPGGFTMERCEEPRRGMHLEYAMWRIGQRLQRDVWKPHKEDIPLTWFEDHWAYIEPRILKYTPHLREYMWNAAQVVRDKTVVSDFSGIIHGDPTYDNMLMRAGHLLITDPLPPSDGMPKLRAVDIAKAMQSLYGYEIVKYAGAVPFRKPKDHPLVIGKKIFDLDDREWTLVRYFTAVHFVRLLPYQLDVTRPLFINLLEQVVADL